MIDESYFKSSFDRVFGDFDMGQYDVRQKRRNKKAIDRDYGGVGEQASKVRQELNAFLPAMDGLSDAEQQELSKYKSRLKDLESVQAPRAGSRRIAGNPYSINSRGLLQGATNLATSAINEEREDRIYGDEQKADRASRGAQVIGKLGEWLGSDAMKQVRENSRDRRAERYSGFDENMSDLQTKKQDAAQRSQERLQYLEEHGPERIKNMNDRELEKWMQNDEQIHEINENIRENQSELDQEEARGKWRQKVEGIKKEADIAVQELKNKDAGRNSAIWQGQSLDSLTQWASRPEKVIGDALNKHRAQYAGMMGDGDVQEAKKYKEDYITPLKNEMQDYRAARSYIRTAFKNGIQNMDVLENYNNLISNAGQDEFDALYNTAKSNLSTSKGDSNGGGEDPGTEKSLSDYGISPSQVESVMNDQGWNRERAEKALIEAAKNK